MARLANYTEKWFFIHLFFIYFKVFYYYCYISLVLVLVFGFYFYLTERKGLFIYLWKKKRIEMETGY